jgi:16S rRNA (cytosine1402-N4)-methyltransferase
VKGSRSGASHDPVLIDEVIGSLQPRAGGQYVDGTFGAGGYSRAILEAADCKVWAIDRDPDVIRHAAEIVTEFEGRLTVIEGRFGDMRALLADHGVGAVDGIALDLGVSSMQLDHGERGFSFRFDGPLDMRQSRDGRSAADIVNETDESVLADIIFKYGEERQARRIARAIVAARSGVSLTRTAQLADIIRSVYRGGSKSKTDPATRTFQAIRIETNDELGELERGLAASEILLAPGGRLAVVSFHSLEDRIVKRFLRDRSGTGRSVSRHIPDTATDSAQNAFRLLRRGAIKPSKADTDRNPRARSARLRIAERLSSDGKGG